MLVMSEGERTSSSTREEPTRNNRHDALFIRGPVTVPNQVTSPSDALKAREVCISVRTACAPIYPPQYSVHQRAGRWVDIAPH